MRAKPRHYFDIGRDPTMWPGPAFAIEIILGLRWDLVKTDYETVPAVFYFCLRVLRPSFFLRINGCWYAALWPFGALRCRFEFKPKLIRWAKS